MKKGFSLIELLAVIIILAILLAITVPGITGIINNATKVAFKDDAKMILAELQNKQLKDPEFDPTTVTESTITTYGLSNENYAKLTVDIISSENFIVIIGQNKWADLVAYGTKDDIEVVNSSDFTGLADNSGANKPNLSGNMIPVMYYNGNWVKADKYNLVGTYSWHNYTNKEWANAVTVTSATLYTYKNAPVGTMVNESDILTYLVWIPRYKYAIPAGVGERSINIVFEKSLAPKSSGTAVGTDYLTHPAFTFGTTELTGFWMAKFELSGTIDAITIKPNLASLTMQTVSSLYTSIRNMESSGNAYGFNSDDVDTHMMKNDEWGAATYLSHSTYGINSEIYMNNSSDLYTGRSGGNVGGSQIKPDGTNEYINTGFYTYDGKCATTTAIVPGIDANCTAVGNTLDNSALAYKASTTGNIYGVFDMAGGLSEYVMGNYNNYSGFTYASNSGFNGLNVYDGSTVTGGIDFPTEQYYNKYTTTVETTACNGGICYGHALSETSGWYGDHAKMVSANWPWLFRGGDYSYAAVGGAFVFNTNAGDDIAYCSTRVVVAMSD
jgi:prepilin-type N-terminal cleavage/methylation domain-containing protein